VPLTNKNSIDSNEIESAKVSVGICILYKLMLDWLKVLSTVKGQSRWLVFLSDTVDLEESGLFWRTDLLARGICNYILGLKLCLLKTGGFIR